LLSDSFLNNYEITLCFVIDSNKVAELPALPSFVVAYCHHSSPLFCLYKKRPAKPQFRAASFLYPCSIMREAPRPEGPVARISPFFPAQLVCADQPIFIGAARATDFQEK
jgi:hypothetical protein